VCDQPRQPLRRNDRIVVQHDEHFAASRLEALVNRLAEPSVIVVPKQANSGISLGQGSQVLTRPVGRSVVDDEQF